jgi:hypothetical protein
MRYNFDFFNHIFMKFLHHVTSASHLLHLFDVVGLWVLRRRDDRSVGGTCVDGEGILYSNCRSLTYEPDPTCQWSNVTCSYYRGSLHMWMTVWGPSYHLSCLRFMPPILLTMNHTGTVGGGYTSCWSNNRATLGANPLLPASQVDLVAHVYR